MDQYDWMIWVEHKKDEETQENSSGIDSYEDYLRMAYEYPKVLDNED